MITAICPGSYDPVTLGHVDVIARASAIFDRVVVGVVGSPRHKTPLFDLDERVAFLEEAVGHLENVRVDVFSELVVETGARTEPQLPLHLRTSRRYGSARLTLFEPSE